MVSKKYLGDYRLENVPHPRTGKLRTVPVYRGEWFAFAENEAEIRRVKRLIPLLTALILIAFLAVLLINAPCGHMFYVMVPFAALIFPVYFQLAGCIRLLTAKTRVTREHKDKLTQRAAVCPMFMTFFSGVSTGGHLLYAVREGLTPLDVVSLVCAAVILVSAIVLFSLRDKVRMDKVF